MLCRNVKHHVHKSYALLTEVYRLVKEKTPGFQALYLSCCSKQGTKPRKFYRDMLLLARDLKYITAKRPNTGSGCIFIINYFLTDDDTRSFCGQCRSRFDCTECAVGSLIYIVHIFILDFNEILVTSIFSLSNI